MGYPVQFRKLLGHKVLIEHRKQDKSFVGTLVGEDKWFIFLEGVKIVNGGQPSEAPFVALHKSKIGLLRKLEEGEA